MVSGFATDAKPKTAYRKKSGHLTSRLPAPDHVDPIAVSGLAGAQVELA
jgi:hypothetical protein